MELGKLFDELGMRMRLLRAAQEEQAHTEELSDREMLMLELLNERGRMTVSEISAAYPRVSESTISTTITRMWRNKKFVSKTINPDNQRVTFVELTEKGKEFITKIKDMRADRMAMLFRAMEITEEERQVLERVFERANSYLDKTLGFEKAETVSSSSRAVG